MNPKTYVLRPQPPMRAFLLAASLAVLGVLLVVVCAATHANGVLMTLAVLLVVVGVVLVGAGMVSMQRLRSFVDLTDEGWTVRTPGRSRSGTWAEVTKVTSSMEGAHLTLYLGRIERTHILAPGNIASDEMNALAADIATRLDRNRGYRQLNESDFAPTSAPASTDAAASVEQPEG